MATIEKRGDTYKIIVSLGYDLDGKQIRKRTTWKPEQGMTVKQVEKELERQKVLFEERCRNGQSLDGTIKFAEFTNVWFTDYAEKQLKAKTIARYRDLMKRITPAIGHIKLEKLQPHHLLSFYTNLEEAGMRDDVKYKCVVDFKAMLKKKELTKAALAEKAGVSIAVLNSVTQGKNITEASARKIIVVLDVDIKSVFEPVNNKGKLSGATIRRHHELISSIMRTAVEWQIVFSNPCERVKPPKVGKSEPRYLDDEQARQLLSLLEGEPPQYQAIIKTLIFTGLRRGELCGLEWPDIDFENSVIHVRRESLYLADKGVFTDSGKTATSIRSIKTPDAVIDVLKAHKAWQAEERLKQGDRWENSNRLFTNQDGAPIHPDVITNWFHHFVEKNNLPDVSVHSLRHTNATLMIASGTAVTTVAKRLGHANASTTTKIYAHAIRSADEAAAETLQDILNPAKNA